MNESVPVESVEQLWIIEAVANKRRAVALAIVIEEGMSSETQVSLELEWPMHAPEKYMTVGSA